MDHLGATLHTPWKAGDKPDEIIGYWAEDLNTFTVTVPPQLRNDVLEIQNVLSKRYCEIDDLRKRLILLERNASNFLSED